MYCFVYFIEIHFPAPAISVWITTSEAPKLGQSDYSLTCSVIGAEHLNSSITYQWTKNNGTQETQIQVGADPNILSFSLLKLSDAAQYTCRATISSFYLNDDITVTNSQDVIFQSKSSNGFKTNPCMMSLIMFTVPSPSLVVLSNVSNPICIHPIGSTVTLTCDVELSSVVDLPVTVNTVWTGPAVFTTTNATQPVKGNPTVYTSTVMVSSLSRDKSGYYTCTVTVRAMTSTLYLSDSNPQSEAIIVTVGETIATMPLNSPCMDYCTLFNPFTAHRCLSLPERVSLC